MRIATLVFATLMVTSVAVSAQTPYIAVYFNSGYSQEAKDCPGVGVIDTWYVAAVNFNTFLSGADFAIQYPMAVTWLADLALPPLALGATPVGLSLGFPLPQNGYNPVPLCQVMVMWHCAECVDPWMVNQIKVVANPGTGFLGGVDYPGYNLVPSQGLTALICPLPIATEQTTWGQIKATYGE